MDTATFQPFQILCLEHEYTALYVELIETLMERKQVWVRPIALATLPEKFRADYCSVDIAYLKDSDYGSRHARAGEQQQQRTPETVHGIPWLRDAVLCDLRLGSDLLWPMHCFRSAIDIEVLPIMAHIGESKPSADGDRQLAQQTLQQFIRQVWKAGINR